MLFQCQMSILWCCQRSGPTILSGSKAGPRYPKTFKTLFLSEVKYKVRLHSQMTWTQVMNGHEQKVHNIPELNHQQGNTEVIKVKCWNHFTASSEGSTEYYCQNTSHAIKVAKLGRWTSLDSSTLSTWTYSLESLYSIAHFHNLILNFSLFATVEFWHDKHYPNDLTYFCIHVWVNLIISWMLLLGFEVKQNMSVSLSRKSSINILEIMRVCLSFIKRAV